MNNKKRVLHIFSALDQGGVENFVMNVYRNIDTEEMQFDFAMTDGRKSFFDNEVLSKGGRIFYFTKGPRTIMRFWSNLSRIIKKEGPFDAVHSHCYFFSGILLLCAWRHKIKIRVAHSHESYKGQKYTLKRKIYESISRIFIWLFSTDMIGCSEQACKHVFGKKCFNRGNVHVINNAIDTSKFSFNKKVREKVRENFNLKGKFVVGHIGRFEFQKNHDFLIDIFKILHDKNNNSVLLLIGGGSLESNIRKKVDQLGLTSNVIFAGLREDANKLLQAMDVFLFPSRFEGLPITLVEAQTADLQCFVSDNITREIEITSLIQYISANDSADLWANAVLKGTKSNLRKERIDEIRKSGFDIKQTAYRLRNLYNGKGLNSK